MSREILYRIFNPTTKKFEYWGYIKDAFLGAPSGGKMSIEYAKHNSQQFTGLHDKNGKEIFEGDICTHPDKKEPFEIKSIEFFFCLQCEGYKAEYFEVIGHIHEEEKK